MNPLNWAYMEANHPGWTTPEFVRAPKEPFEQAEHQRWKYAHRHEIEMMEEGARRCWVCDKHGTPRGVNRIVLDRDPLTDRLRGLACLTCRRLLVKYQTAALAEGHLRFMDDYCRLVVGHD